VLSLTIPKKWLEVSLKIFAILLLTIPALVSLHGGRIPAQNMPVIIGRIEGDAVVVKTTTPAGVEINAAPTVVASGSDITLQTGHALLSLDAGGEVSICGPAHFTLLKSATAVTLALDYGRVHPSLDSPESFMIYTPTIIATPISIAGGTRDATLGLSETGEMCILTARGAMRVDPQFSSQSLIVPQGGAANLEGGQIKSLPRTATDCSCDFPRASMERPKPLPAREVSALSHSPQSEQKSPDPSIPAAAGSPQEPVYTVLMPPLSFNANSPSPAPDPSPETILLVREVRLRPSVIFRGHVDPAPVQAPPEISPAPAPAAPSPAAEPPTSPQPGIMARMWNFLRGVARRTP
jgi:hypothetical protein